MSIIYGVCVIYSSVENGTMHELINFSFFSLLCIYLGIFFILLGLYFIRYDLLKAKRKVPDLLITENGFSLIDFLGESHYYWEDVDALFVDQINKNVIKFIPSKEASESKRSFGNFLKNFFDNSFLSKGFIRPEAYRDHEELRTALVSSFDAFKKSTDLINLN